VAELTARDLWHDPELIPLFASSGCYGVYAGIESVREKLPKGLYPHEYKDLVARCHDNGMLMLGAFVFGVGEDEDEVHPRDEPETDIKDKSRTTTEHHTHCGSTTVHTTECHADEMKTAAHIH
jgi:hypothetical protein